MSVRLGGGLAAALLLVSCTRGKPTEPPAQTVATPPAVAPVEEPEPEPEPEPVQERLVAQVNGVALPWSAFDAIHALKVKKYTDRGREIPPSADRRYRKSIIERLTYHEMLRQRVVELGVDVDPARIDERSAQQRAGIRDWAKHLERRGETEASLRAMLEAELRERLILEREGELEVTRAEVEAEYEKVKHNWDANEPRIRASHILVVIAPAGPEDDPAALEAAARAEADRLYAQVSAPGADFAAVARESSSGASQAKGGDIGIFTRSRMAEEFSKAAFAMKVGEISKPVQTTFGFHIIRVTGKWPRGTLPLEALEDELRDRLEQRKLHVGRRALKQRLEEQYPVIHYLLAPEELEPSEQRGPPYADWPDQAPEL